MSSKGGIQRYIYWSDRRVRTLLEDQGISLVRKKQRKWTSPDLKGFAPTFERTDEESEFGRPELAALVEKVVGESAVTDLRAPGPIHYTKGVGDIVFGEFSPSNDPMHAVMYTEQDLAWRNHVGVCLFGSMDNFADFIAESGPSGVKRGWTSSSAPAVLRYIRSWDVNSSGLQSPESVAAEALKIAKSQGEWTLHRPHGWQRAFTYGDVIGIGEWFAEIYLDCEFPEDCRPSDNPVGRVWVGAPLWVRTPSLRALRLYSDFTEEELDNDHETRHRSKPANRRRR